MIVRHLYVVRIAYHPAKADTPLIINRMLYCPSRSPRSFSSRFPGGTRRSSSDSAASRSNNLRSAGRCTGGGNFFTRSRRNRRSVSLSRKVCIIHVDVNAVRYDRQLTGRGPKALLALKAATQFGGAPVLAKTFVENKNAFAWPPLAFPIRPVHQTNAIRAAIGRSGCAAAPLPAANLSGCGERQSSTNSITCP